MSRLHSRVALVASLSSVVILPIVSSTNASAAPCLDPLIGDGKTKQWRRNFGEAANWQIPNYLPTSMYVHPGITLNDIRDWTHIGFSQWQFCPNIPADYVTVSQYATPITSFRATYVDRLDEPAIPMVGTIVMGNEPTQPTHEIVTSAHMQIIRNPVYQQYVLYWTDCVTCTHTSNAINISTPSIMSHEFGHVIGFAECTNANYLMGLWGPVTGSGWKQFDACEIESANAWYDCVDQSGPGSMTATATASSGHVLVEWNDLAVAMGAQSYAIMRATDCRGPYTQVGARQKLANVQSYQFDDGSVTESRPYYYYVTDGNCATTGATPLNLPTPATPPGSPTGLVAEWSGPGVVHLSWAAASGSVTGYRVWRGVPSNLDECFQMGSGMTCPDELSLGVTTGTSFVDTLTAGQQATYVVCAYNVSHQNENYSLETLASPPCVIQATLQDSTLTMCPAGDADTLRIIANVQGACDESWESANVTVEAVRRVGSTPGVRLWGDSELGFGEVISLIGSYSPATHTATIEHARVSGCGTLYFNLFLNGQEVFNTNLRVDVRSLDQDTHVVGSVDRFDLAAITAADLASASGCWDLNWSGGAVSQGDLVSFAGHVLDRDDTGRRLVEPNGGDDYGPGDVVPITWHAGQGDSARVTLRVVHAAYDTSLIVSDTLDTGNYNWLVPPTNKAGTAARVEVLHSAGYYKVDYADVGRDASDGTMTFRATAVSDLAAVTGKNTAVLTWSDPMQGSPVADEHEIWYRHSSPLTDEDFASGSTKLTPTPWVVGTTHCVEINSLTQCRTYYFAMRTMDRGVWSKLSNVAVSQTACSGYEVVFCEESGLLAGGGGEGELAQATRLASAGTPLPATGAEVLAENSLLCGSRGDMVEDLFRLSTGDALSRGVSEVVLRESALREAEVDAVGLGMVAHPSDTEAVPGGGTIWVGVTHPIDRARDATGTDVAAALTATGEAGIGFRGGDVVTIEPGGDAAGAALVLESRNRVFAARNDSSGILIQRPDRSGAWSTVARIQPRREFDRQAIPTEGVSTLRLVFLKEYSVRAIERLDGITAATPRALSLADASHSRLGSVDGAVDRSGGEKTTLAMGDTLALRFTPLEPEAGMEHSYFLSIRGAVETAAEDTRLQDAASLVVAAGPAISNSLGAARPNPTAGGAVIAFTIAAPGQTELSIYDVSGRRMRTVQSAELPMGAHEVQWDGRDAGGRVVAAGVYFYRLQAGPWRSERKLIVLQK